jgi:hypothetical protein
VTPSRVQRPYIWPHPRLAVNCARPTRFGNPFRTGDAAADVTSYRQWLHDPDAQPIRFGPRRLYRPLTDADRREIAGRDLACHCAIDSPCHANVLLAWANTEGIP